jgi:phenylacetate-CoA ligase
MDRVGLQPPDIQHLEDIVKLPLLSRDEARQYAAERRSEVAPLPEIAKSTSGSSGKPLPFAYDKNSDYYRQAVQMRGYAWCGCLPGDTWVDIWGALDHLYAPTLKKRLKVALDRALRREYYFDSNDGSNANLDRTIDAIRRLRPRALVCYAQAGVALARRVLETDARDWPDLNVICGAERLFPEHRKFLVKAFGPEVFETYGSREFMLMACECEAHRGLHVNMENLIVEVLVRESTGVRPAEPGEVGEVAVTDLNNFGMPFVRYLNGDLACMEPESQCSCGRAMPRIRSVEGRVTETLHDAAGNAVNGLFFNVLFSVLADEVAHFQVRQRLDRSIDLKIVPTAKFNDELRAQIQKKCSRVFGDLPMRTDLVEHIAPAPSGKLEVVVVER